MTIELYDCCDGYYPVCYYTLSDILMKTTTNKNNKYPTWYNAWFSITKSNNYDYNAITKNIVVGTAYENVVNTLFESYIIPLANQITVLIKDDCEEEITDTDITNIIDEIAVFVNETAPRYYKLISLYKDNESKLMNQLSSISSTTTKAVDTPQDDQISTLDENYLSSIGNTETKTTSDTNTVMARLEEIRRYYKNLYSQWLTEFKRKFSILIGV